MAIHINDYLSWVNWDWINQPLVQENWLAISVAAGIIVACIIGWIVWRIMRYLTGMKVRDYHSNGPLDKMIDRKIDILAGGR